MQCYLFLGLVGDKRTGWERKAPLQALVRVAGGADCKRAFLCKDFDNAKILSADINIRFSNVKILFDMIIFPFAKVNYLYANTNFSIAIEKFLFVVKIFLSATLKFLITDAKTLNAHDYFVIFAEY